MKIDDGFLDNPKILQAGPLAGFLYISSIAWSNRSRTDGHIPKAQVSRLVNFDGFAHHMWMGEVAGGGDDADAYVLAGELVEARLWEQTATGYAIHNYHAWQTPASEIDVKREQARNRMRNLRSREKPAKMGA